MEEDSLREVKIAQSGTLEEEDNSQQEEQTWQTKVTNLSQVIANDCNLKTGRMVKFNQHVIKVKELRETKSELSPERECLLLAGIYKNLGKLGEEEQMLQKALILLKKGNGKAGVVVRWTLQLTAMKSQLKKQHQECFDLAVKVIADCQLRLRLFQAESNTPAQKEYISSVLQLAREKTKDQIIWKFNHKPIEQILLQKLKKDVRFSIPFFPTIDFQIADIMALQSCRGEWWLGDGGVREIVTYMSIGFFTLATQTYYMGDYSHKNDHLKALKVALLSFGLSCNYIKFLLKILADHFGQQLQAISQEKSLLGEYSDMIRYLPPETKELSLKDLTFPE